MSVAVEDVTAAPDDVETSVLGALITRPALFGEIEKILSLDSFDDPRNRQVYELLVGMHTRGAVIEETTVTVEIERAGLMKKDESRLFVLDLVHYADVIAEVAIEHAHMVAENGIRRIVQQEAETVAINASKAPLDELRSRLEVAHAVLGATPTRGAHRFIGGGSFILDATTEVEVVWGRNDDVLMAAGESLMIVGPQGIGKSTVAQQYILGRCGLRNEILGYPVCRDERRVLYIAADRPRQAQRSFSRMVTEDERALLDERLIVWPGPPEFDIAAHPGKFASFVADTGAGTVVIDSLKDVAMDLVKDETGSRVNAALQRVLASGVEVVVLHHQRKAQHGAGKPKKIDDIYGSTWLTTGMGSILLLWGEAGDPVVELTHLKQPVAEVGPMKLLHDHANGSTSVTDQPDPLRMLRSSTLGVTATDAARNLYGSDSPTRSEIEKARRVLNGLANKGLAHHEPGRTGGRGGGGPDKWFAVDTQMEAL